MSSFCEKKFEHADIKATSGNRGRRRIDPQTLQEIRRCCACEASKANFMSMNDQQSNFKYGILLNGHSVADRFARLFNGSQVIFVPACDDNDVGQTTWFSDMLYPMQHFVPVMQDGSDLDSKIQWVNNNPEACERIRQHCASLLNYEGVKEWWFYACC